MMRILWWEFFFFCAIPIFANDRSIAPNGRLIVVTDHAQWLLASSSECMAERLRDDCGAARDPLGLSLPTHGGPVILQETKAPSQKNEPPLATFFGGDQEFDLRAVRWGMTIAKVKESESIRPIEETPASLSYRLKQAGMTAAIVYVFASGKLVAAQMTVTQAKIPGGAFYEGLERLMLKLCKTHGAPQTRDYVWADETYKNDRTKWGLAIGKGQLACSFVWKSPRSTIDLQANGSAGVFTTKIAMKHGPELCK